MTLSDIQKANKIVKESLCFVCTRQKVSNNDYLMGLMNKKTKEQYIVYSLDQVKEIVY